jgi:SAM-dependent methyltransferase
VTAAVLDLGCGTNKRPGAVGVDNNPDAAPDVLHDLERFPYPFDDSSFDEILLDNVLEHLGDVVRTMEELHRIGQPGALIEIYVPYFRSRWAAVDPTHRHQFTVDSFSYFDPGHPFFDQYRYSPARFRVESVRFNERFPGRGLRARVATYANRRPQAYEARLSPLIPLDELTFRLRVVKD